jgi:hypothetical protein
MAQLQQSYDVKTAFALLSNPVTSRLCRKFVAPAMLRVWSDVTQLHNCHLQEGRD